MQPSLASPSRPSASAESRPHWAALTALGIVYGDLGTSPLYTLQTVVHAMGGRFTPESALGILSLIVWTLIITISIKYCLLVMRADNNGEGGILALMSLVGANSLSGRMLVLTAMGLLGAALIYGDGAITPAISVLSALEGVNVVTSAFKPFIMPCAVGILLLLFAAQRFGTAKIGAAFGPIMALWFVIIAGLGLTGILHHPAVLAAIDPRHAIGFLAHSGGTGLLVLGGVFLCITGGEAMYADMGHIGRGPIRFSWYAIVLPALLLSYAGQTALILERGTIHGNPFFQLAPARAIYPLVAIATVATIIASQAIITGAFSMTRQAMQLGWLPGVNIRQTSDKVYGQIYVPVVNWLMMVATVGITIAFRTSDHLAGAYGTAVSTTMLLTTCLLFTAMMKIWRWPAFVAILVAGVLLVVDLGFFGANLLKIADGGWLPLTLGALVFVVMATWHSGVQAFRARLAETSTEPEDFLSRLKAGRVPRVPGTAVFLTRSEQDIPPLLVDHVRLTGALHEHVVALTVIFEQAPRVADAERSAVECVGQGVWRMTVRFGFVEIPDLSEAMKSVTGLDPEVRLDKALFFATRDLVASKAKGSIVAQFRASLFSFLYRNAAKVVDRFNLPPRSVVEIGQQIEI